MEKIEKKGYLGHYKIWIENDHLLQLIDFEVYDSGIYICKSRNVEDNDTIFTYILDGKKDIRISQLQNCKILFIHFNFLA